MIASRDPEFPILGFALAQRPRQHNLVVSSKIVGVSNDRFSWQAVNLKDPLPSSPHIDEQLVRQE
jgi:hypothetical protein